MIASVGIFAALHRRRAAGVALEAIQWLRSRGVQVMLAPELTSEQRRAVKIFELERWFPKLLTCMTARPIK